MSGNYLFFCRINRMFDNRLWIEIIPPVFFRGGFNVPFLETVDQPPDRVILEPASPSAPERSEDVAHFNFVATEEASESGESGEDGGRLPVQLLLIGVAVMLSIIIFR